MESDVVMLIEGPKYARIVGEKSDMKFIYSGMTRAKAALVIFAHESWRSEFEPVSVPSRGK
jgi:hypothetical protein